MKKATIFHKTLSAAPNSIPSLSVNKIRFQTLWLLDALNHWVENTILVRSSKLRFFIKYFSESCSKLHCTLIGFQREYQVRKVQVTILYWMHAIIDKLSYKDYDISMVREDVTYTDTTTASMVYCAPMNGGFHHVISRFYSSCIILLFQSRHLMRPLARIQIIFINFQANLQQILLSVDRKYLELYEN